MFKQILVPLDGSPTSNAALGRAIGMANVFGAAITVVMVYDPYTYIPTAAEYGTYQAQYLEDLRLEAQNTVSAASKTIEEAGIKAYSQVVESQRIWRGILDAAQSAKADLIVMGSHGRSGLDKLVMGSVAQRVLQHTSLPVLVVRD
jgi:nucleotide-binding universal stress UspA family protein